MNKLPKYLFFLFFFSVLFGHGIADAQSSARERVNSACKSFVNQNCDRINRNVPPQSSVPNKVKNCFSASYKGKGVTFEAFLKNSPAQSANSKAASNGKDVEICPAAKKPHKSCHIIVKKGKTVLYDAHELYSTEGIPQQCDLRRGQFKANGSVALNAQEAKIAKRKKENFGNRDPRKRRQKLEDTRKAGMITKVRSGSGTAR